MDRVPKLQHRNVLRGCETDRDAHHLMAKAYCLITGQSDRDEPGQSGEQKNSVSLPQPKEVSS